MEEEDDDIPTLPDIEGHPLHSHRPWRITEDISRYIYKDPGGDDVPLWVKRLRKMEVIQTDFGDIPIYEEESLPEGTIIVERNNGTK